MVRSFVLFGATGSIGTSTLSVIRRNRDKFALIGISAYSNFEQLARIAREFNVKNIGIGNKEKFYTEHAKNLFSKNTNFFIGMAGNCELAGIDEADAVVMAIPGVDGILPTLSAIQKKKTIMLASKEVLVAAGKIVTDTAKGNNVDILPIDSEHNAIFQCIRDERKFLKKVVLTASGGPFRQYSAADMHTITIEQALNHPTWKMGKKITIDSATMANKGFEMIEAQWLFDLDPSDIEVIVHPESIVHSMVEFCDGSILAQLGPHSMEYPIANCLFFPERTDNNPLTLDFSKRLSLNFSEPDYSRFPCLKLAEECLKKEDHSSAIFLAANDLAVQAFLEKKIKFTEIAEVAAATLDAYHPRYEGTIEHVLNVIHDAQEIAKFKIENHH